MNRQTTLIWKRALYFYSNIQFIQDLHIDIAEEVRERMIHGTKHEIDAIATIVAKVLPVYFPNKVFVEEGCYVIPGDNYR
jgi:myosin-crossreactive antigen